MLSSDATVLASDLDAAAHLVMAVGALAAYRRSAASPLRWILPNYYRFRSAPETHAELGLAETGREQDEAPRLRSLQRAVETALGALQSAFSDAPGRNEPLAALAQWASRLVHDEAGLRALIEVRHVLALLERHHAKAFVGEVLAQAVAHTKPTRSVEATAYAEWAERALRRTSDLLSPEAHARLVGQYGEADRDLRLWARRSVMHAVVNKRPSANSGEMTRLEQFDRAQRRPALRKMLAETRGAVQGIKPCILVSPLAVAQYLCHKAGRDYQFDVCIVDEASMVPTADMVVAISLAPQLIVCGDSKQMPPTDFFRKVISSNDDDDPDDDPGAVAPIKFESVLDECAPLLRPAAELTYHYRSRDETLIAFSNAHFYGGRLIAFPDCWEQREESGVKFEFVPDGVYGRGGTTTNPQEARRVVELLRAERARWPDRSVAITAMSTAQQAEIQARLYDLASLDPIVRLWSESGGRARNLETIQGDECDTMILSVGYGKDAAGKLTMNFGPLGRAKGERRLNVAVTRARWKSILVSSIHATDINPTSTSPEGLLRLRDYLDYAERGEIALSSTIRVNAGADTESPFEAAVLAELMRRGLDCVPQVGVGKYRIDIGIRDPDVTGRFLLGVECDGAMYHSAPTARDRDLLRERVLTNMGWEIARVWSTAWFQDPEREVQRLLERFQAAVRRQQSSSN